MKKKELLNLLLSKFLMFLGKRSENNKIKDKRRVKIYSQIDLNDEQKRKIDNFYLRNYGKKIPHNWHRLFQSFTGRFDEKYFPELLYIPDLERKMNPANYSKVIEDKTLLDFWISGSDVKTPKILISSINGIIRNEKYEIIKFSEIKRILQNQKEKLFLKPSIESSSGEGCRIIEIKNGIDTITNKSIEQILEIYNGNFIIQEKLTNSQILSRLHPNSINTFRVVTYILNGEIYHCPLVLRIGQGGKHVDNAHAGGMFIGVKDNGELCDTAYTEFQTRYLEHPDTKIKFKGYKIPAVEEIIKKAKSLHAKIPQLGIISWDFTIDEKENIVLVEINVRGGGIWVMQMAHGCGPFGENTAEILKFISKKEIVSQEII